MFFEEDEKKQTLIVGETSAANIAFDVSEINSDVILRFTTDDAQIFRDEHTQHFQLTDNVKTVQLLDDVQYYLRNKLEVFFNYDKTKIQ